MEVVVPKTRQRVSVVAIIILFLSSIYGVAQTRGRGSVQAPPAGDIPVIGIANVTFKVSDLKKARAYYQDVLGMTEAFQLKDSTYFKVNDDQFIEVTPTLKPGELIREARVVFQSTDLEKLHSIYTERGLKPTAIAKGPDGNPVFQIGRVHV